MDVFSMKWKTYEWSRWLPDEVSDFLSKVGNFLMKWVTSQWSRQIHDEVGDFWGWEKCIEENWEISRFERCAIKISWWLLNEVCIFGGWGWESLSEDAEEWIPSYEQVDNFLEVDYFIRHKNGPMDQESNQNWSWIINLDLELYPNWSWICLPNN